jgi:UDP-2,3-diacylglucosamine hydrolase
MKTDSEKYLFISDLHLDPDRRDVVDIFLQFLNTQARTAKALYILGDLFEVWIGDDEETEFTTTIVEAIKSLVESGVAVFFMHGNRDFLAGERFEQLSGVHIIPDPFPVHLAGHKCLLLHGDTLCTGDVKYIEFRSLVRNPQWQQDFLSKSLEERRGIARALREKSLVEMSQKEEAIMDVEEQAVTKVCKEFQPELIIHGHTHRPGIHEVTDCENTQRIVLADWYDSGSYLQLDKDGFNSISL